MKKNIISVLKRLSGYLFLAVMLTMALTVMHKLIFKSEEWLWLSVSWSVVYVSAIPCKSFVINETDDLFHRILSGAFATICVFLLTAFVIGVALNKSDWFKYTFDITAPFAFALALGHPLKESQSKIEDEKEEIEDCGGKEDGYDI